ncbi:signal transduction histidine kinase [Frondihabitans sp. PhB188]|uniref:sensor histidine kinase n=1 Tax=Frondihabitans sp. PhB188 TaxID=2485200 RepID=UPI000F48428B|nr:ATP-binding protein [Frondihabitans sp. PhB188]ROQ40000.1 signal transduction histidine kinase [Frondihabitans sp. PhB188]
MAATLAIVAGLLVLLALPEYVGDHRPDRFPLLVVALCLAGSMVAPLPLALARSTGLLRTGLWLPVASYVALLVVEPFTLRDPLPLGSTPWLLGLSLIAFSCTALAESNPFRAGVICLGIDAALAVVYADRLPIAHTLITNFGLLLLAAGLIAGVRALRARADRADQAEERARMLFEDHQRQGALEAERVRTDALLHDTVLAALLAAAGNDAPDRAAGMARAALDIVSATSTRPQTPPRIASLGTALSNAEADLARFRGVATLDLTRLDALELPSEVAEALISATVQALRNSVTHAGPSARRTAAGSRLDDGGLRITVSDDGSGFDLGSIPQERLGVRVSILERVRHVGGSASIHSAPGEGTTVVLEWHPDRAPSPLTRRPGESLFTVIPRRVLYRILGALIVVASLIATLDALLVTHAYASVAASVLGLSILPALVRGARRGTMSNRAAWVTTGVGVLLCCIATIGLDAADFDSASIARFTCGVLAGAAMGWMAGRRLPPLITMGALVTQITLWAGPSGVIRLGLAGEIVIVVAGLLIHHAIRKVTAAAEVAARQHEELTIQQAELDAFDTERQQRLQHAGNTAAPILRHIIAVVGRLGEDARTECRVLEQALRDEIRGRSLLNEAVRQVVSAHRRRGALVQILDDGGLDGLDPAALDLLLDDVARHLEPVRSSRIIIRTGRPESDTAITIVASTPDETAAALGLDADDEVDLWVTIPHPEAVELAA